MIRQNKILPGIVASPLKKGIPKPVADTSCKYKPRTCHQPVLENYDYCLKHILEDKSAPFRPCNYVYPSNNKRCFMPARQLDKVENSYCALHLWKTQVKNDRRTSKHFPPTTPEYLLSTLSHYVRPARSTSNTADDAKNPSRTKPINPFVEADTNKIAQKRMYALECASESDSDVEPATLDSIWQGADEDSSDAESIDSQLDDPLKHAGHYTVEEVIAITRSKMTRLQCLYQKQIDRLQYLYRVRRLQYLQNLRKERETLCSIHDQAKSSVKEQKLYEKLKALNRYHKRSFAHSLAYFQSMAKRTKEITKGAYKPPPGSLPPRCSFTEGGVRCQKFILPLTKYCHQHILEDTNQSLFKPCDCEKADSKCQVPVTDVGFDETCLLHVKLTVLPHSNYPDTSMKNEDDKKSNDESEVDASATESAFSTDQRDSPENSIINNEDLSRKDEDSELFCDKTGFQDSDLQHAIMDVSETPEVGKEEVVDSTTHDSLNDVRGSQILL